MNLAIVGHSVAHQHIHGEAGKPVTFLVEAEAVWRRHLEGDRYEYPTLVISCAVRIRIELDQMVFFTNGDAVAFTIGGGKHHLEVTQWEGHGQSDIHVTLLAPGSHRLQVA